MNVDQFISQLYRQANQVTLAEFPYWALDLLQQVLPFDGAIWGTGHIATKNFHTKISVDVPTSIFTQLKKHLAINPIFTELIKQQGKPVDMSDVFDDVEFYQSILYRQCFAPYGIERILSSIHVEQQTGVFTLLTLYRFERDNKFSEQEKSTQQRLLFHLLSAYEHCQIQTLNEQDGNSRHQALVDGQGFYRTVSGDFVELINEYAHEQSHQQLPIKINQTQHDYKLGPLHINQQAHGELYKLSLRFESPLDSLSERELQVINELAKGKTFKEIAKCLSLSPSTVSNHLYRIYGKLGVHSRSELIKLAQQ